MKSLKTILTGAIAMTLAGQAFADVTVYLTGSTAYRKQINVSIARILGATADGVNIQGAYDGTGGGIAGANRAVWQGTVSGVTGTVTIKTSWTGSAAGIQAATQPVAASFLGNVTLANASTSGGGTTTTGGNNAGTATLESVNPEVVMSDVDQVATPFTGGNPLVKNQIGIVDFVWVASKDALTTSPFTNITNITPQIAQAIFGGLGKGDAALFTGNANDTEGNNAVVFATGRNPDSGTRLTAFAETGVGLFATVQQYQPGAATGGQITTHQLWPQDTVNGITVSLGNSGFSSGGTMRDTIANNGSVANLHGVYVTYLSYSDATAANGIGVGLKELSYDGVTYGGNHAKITEGQYTFWSYEWLMYLQSLGGDKLTVAQALLSRAQTDAPIKLTDMHCSRPGDGGTITR